MSEKSFTLSNTNGDLDTIAGIKFTYSYDKNNTLTIHTIQITPGSNPPANFFNSGAYPGGGEQDVGKIVFMIKQNQNDSDSNALWKLRCNYHSHTTGGANPGATHIWDGFNLPLRVYSPNWYNIWSNMTPEDGKCQDIIIYHVTLPIYIQVNGSVYNMAGNSFKSINTGSSFISLSNTDIIQDALPYDGSFAEQNDTIYAQNSGLDGNNQEYINLLNFDTLRTAVKEFIEARTYTPSGGDTSSFDSYKNQNNEQRINDVSTSLSNNEIQDNLITQNSNENEGKSFANAINIIYDLINNNKMSIGTFNTEATNIINKGEPQLNSIIPALKDYFTIVNWWNTGLDDTSSHHCNSACTGFCSGNCAGTTNKKTEGYGCENGCGAECRFNCGNNCQGACKGGSVGNAGGTQCFSTTCAQVCGWTCNDAACGATCSNTCANNCGGGCKDVCGSNCSGTCTFSANT